MEKGRLKRTKALQFRFAVCDSGLVKKGSPRKEGVSVRPQKGGGWKKRESFAGQGRGQPGSQRERVPPVAEKLRRRKVQARSQK